MRHIERLSGDTSLKEVTYYGRAGDALKKGTSYNKRTHFAKIVKDNISKSESSTYYIKIYQGTPFDPMGPYGRRERVLDTQMRRVSKNTFDFYMTYLKTNNSIYLTKAQRGFLND